MNVDVQVLGFVCLLAATAAADVRTFAVDATAKGCVLPNPSQVLTSWSVPEPVDPARLSDREWDVRKFAEWVEIMAATGGNATRDGYRDPNDRSVTDDYDFTKLVRGCRGILALGMKPYLKLGNVPMKLSSNISMGDFSINVRPPDDYAAYARYMSACAKALVTAFGREELLKWRYAVLTEYENAGWFKDASGDAERTFHAYCLLYEKTVEAFAREISPDLTFGVHAMAVAEGLWDERRFFAFAAVRRLPLKFVTASFYDAKPGVATSGLSLPKTIAHLRAGAEKAGFKNLFFGVDEGRILEGASGGKHSRELPLRIVGDTYQAAFDARVVRQLFDSGADYFAAWGYMTGPNAWFDGIPSVSFHVAREAAKFKGMRRLSVRAKGGEHSGLELEAVAGLDEAGRRMQVMAYSFTNALSAAGTTRVRFEVRVPTAWRGQAATLTRRQVDDRVNWFPLWRKDRKALGIGDDRFSWSPDDPAVLRRNGLLRDADRKKFQETLLPRYREMSRLKPEVQSVALPGEKPLEVELDLQVNSAVFLELRLDSPAAEAVPSATERLRARLLEIGRSDKFLYAWSTSWWSWNDEWYDKFRQHAGVLPSMYFCEFRDICGTWNSPDYYATNRAKFTNVVTREYRERGAVPLVTWHLENPYIPPRWGASQDHQGFRYRYSEPGYPPEHRYVMHEIAEGTGAPCGSGRVDGVKGKTFSNPRAWYEWVVKDMAAFWRTVRDDAGQPIPIVFRLFHEMDGDWFWWGTGSTTAQDYIAVYRLTVDLIRKELGAENVLFCYGPDRCWTEAGEEGKSGYLKWYPGDAYVDMLAIDDYSIGKKDTAKTTEGALKRLRIISALGRERNKFCGIAECGAQNSADDFYTIIHRLMTSPGVDFAIAATYDGPWTFPVTEAGKADMRKFFQLPEVLSGDARKLFR